MAIHGEEPAEALPTVDVLMPAYNYGNYIERAARSALEQAYPADRLRLIVVNDGSTDDTLAVVRRLGREYGERLLLIDQPNGGPSAAINRALQEARAALIAVLDADDVWLPEKIRRQAELLRDDPQLSMVFCDMRVVDGDEQTVRPSQVGNIGAFPRRAFARLLAQNVATQSAILLRRVHAHPLPPGVPYSDWWFALCAAQAGEVRYLREPLALYREHGANLTSGVSGASAVREHLKEVRFQRWALRNLDLSALTAPEAQLVWSGVEQHAARALQAADTLFVQLVEVDEVARAEAQAAAARAEAAAQAGDWDQAASSLLRAMGADPLDPALRASFETAVARAAALADAPHPLAGVEGFVLLTDVEDLLADTEMLTTYARALERSGSASAVTLAIDATRLAPESATEQLQSLVERAGLADRADIAMVAVIDEPDPGQRHRLRSRADARYRREDRGEDAQPPTFTPATIDAIASLLGETTGTPERPASRT